MIHKTLTSIALGLLLVPSALAVTKTACCDAAMAKAACCKAACCDAPCCAPAKRKAVRLAKKGVLKSKAAARTNGGCCSMPCCGAGACCATCE